MLIGKDSHGTKQMEIERLIAGKIIAQTFNENLTHNKIDRNIGDIWRLLYMIGYLTVAQKPSGSRHMLRIPNHGIRQIYMRQVMVWK